MRRISTYLLLAAFAFITVGCEVDLSKLTDAKNSANDIINEPGHIVLVPGYGAPVLGNPTYQEYIQSVVDFVEDEDNAVTGVVFTGSYSSLQDTSEAESMNQYFNRQADLNTIADRGIRVYKEECAIVSWQNITYSEELLDEAGEEFGKLTVFGDTGRREKLQVLATSVFNADQSDKLSLTRVSFNGMDLSGVSETHEMRATKFAAEMAGAYDTEIGNQILQERITKWTDDFNYDVADNLVAKGCEQFAGFR